MKYHPPFGSSDPNQVYINGDRSIGRKGSIPPAEGFEYTQREIVNIIEKSFQAPTDDDLFQLLRAVRDGRLSYAVDTGGANQLQIALDPPLDAYRAGLELKVFVSHSCTGPTTINVNGLGERSIRRADGSELDAGDIVATEIANIIDDGTRFQLANYKAATGTTTTNVYQVDIPFVHDTGTTNHIVAAFSPAITTLTDGMLIEVKLLHLITGATTINVNGLTVRNVVHGDQTPLQSGDGYVDQNVLLSWDALHSVWQLMLGRGSVTGGVIPPSGGGSGKSLQFLAPAANSYGFYTWLERTPGVASNRRVWTYSVFVKQAVGAWRDQLLLCAGSPAIGGAFTGYWWSEYCTIGYPQNLGHFNVWWGANWPQVSGMTDVYGNYTGYVNPANVLMDTNWHHVLINATSSLTSVYVDGVLVNTGATTGGLNGGLGDINNTVAHVIGTEARGAVFGSTCKMAEIHFVDGITLGWTSFADTVAGRPVPKTYSGAYGTNGYYLNFSDASVMDATHLGKDYSGQSNNWTPWNFDPTLVTDDYPS